MLGTDYPNETKLVLSAINKSNEEKRFLDVTQNIYLESVAAAVFERQQKQAKLAVKTSDVKADAKSVEEASDNNQQLEKEEAEFEDYFYNHDGDDALDSSDSSDAVQDMVSNVDESELDSKQIKANLLE